MKKKRELLEEHLLKLFIEHNANTEVFTKVKEALRDKMYSGRVAGIFDLNIQIGLISDSELCLITQAMYNVLGNTYSQINPTDWFKDSEIAQANEKHIDEEVEEFIIFKDMSKKPSENEDEWLGYVSYGQIKKAWEQGFLKYNQDTQRAGKIVEMFGRTYVLPTIFKSNVLKIKNAMIKNRYHTNMLTFNITNTPTHKKAYNKENRELKVWGGSTEIAVIDGGHRTLAIIKAVDESPELENEYIAVMIKNVLVSTAQEFIFQEAQGVKQDAKTLAMVNDEDVINRFCRNINKQRRDNSLYQKIGLLQKEYDNCLIPLSKFIEAMDDNFGDIFKRENSDEIENLSNYIIEFFNVVVDNYEEYYIGDIEELKEKYISYTSNFTVGLIKVANMLYGNDDWDCILINILENINWDRKDSEWKRNKIISPNFTDATKKKIYNYFESLVCEQQ